MDVDLGQALDVILSGEDDATPKVAGVFPDHAKRPVVVVTLLDQVVAVQIAGQPPKHCRIRHLLIDDF
jgi:hypothetical protein